MAVQHGIKVWDPRSLAHRENLVASMLHGFKRPAGHA